MLRVLVKKANIWRDQSEYVYLTIPTMLHHYVYEKLIL
jgi:hypothetical protein